MKKLRITTKTPTLSWKFKAKAITVVGLLSVSLVLGTEFYSQTVEASVIKKDLVAMAEAQQSIPKKEAVATLKRTEAERSYITNYKNCVAKIAWFLTNYPNHKLNNRANLIVTSINQAAFVVNKRQDCEAAKRFVAIMATETSLGRTAVDNNLFGLKGYNCKKVKCNKQGFEVFTSIEAAIRIGAHRLYRPYLGQKSMSAFDRYCQSSCTYWKSHVNNFIKQMS